ncbi:uncharacterized protein [Hyperolius riggenbachi]|uniref:uncharacterized protein n=1 Tax=Hyperolius riggenbachi TaxID=752182 RepID=UPI0035A3C8FB
MPEGSGILFTGLSCKKASGGVPLHPQSERVEQGRKISKIQDGQYHLCYKSVTEGLLPGIIGSQGRLSTHPDRATVSAVPKVCHQHSGRDHRCHYAKKGYVGSRPSNLLLPCSPVGTTPFKNTAKLDPKELEQKGDVLRKKIANSFQSKGSSQLVAESSSSVRRSTVVFSSRKNHDNRRQLLGMGGSYRLTTSTGSVVHFDERKIVKQQRVTGSMDGPTSLLQLHQPLSCSSTFRQRQCSGVHQQARRNEKSSFMVSDLKNPIVGGEKSKIHQSSASEGCKQLSCGLPKQIGSKAGRVDPELGGFPGDLHDMGTSRSGSICKEEQRKVSTLLFPMAPGQAMGDRCLFDRLEHQTNVCFSPSIPDPEGSQQDLSRQGSINSDSSILAEKTVVQSITEVIDQSSVAFTSTSGSIAAGASFSSKSSADASLCMEPEWNILKSKGFSDGLSETLIQSRKKVTRVIYQKAWRVYNSWCLERSMNVHSSTSVLEFLQAGFEKGLSISTLKVQTAAISVFLQRRLAQEEFILRFFQAIKRLRPVLVPRTPSWDLNIVLQAMCGPPFEPIDQVSEKLLSLKMAFLLAITSARRVGELQALSIKPPYCIISEDKVTLRPDIAFLPKVVSTFHRTQEIFLPSFCEKQSNEKEKQLHCLDVRRCLLQYLERSKSWRKTDALFILFAGKNRGLRASKPTIARWIRQAILMAYQSQGMVLPTSVKAHSTRSVATSWAERAGASIEQICRAATWSSQNTFVKHYRLNLLSSGDLAFGRKVLQAVVPP